MRFFASLVSLLLAALAIYLIVAGKARIDDSKPSVRWRSTHGTISASGIRKSGGAGRSIASYLVEVRYDYSVGGRHFRGASVYSHAFASFSQKEKALAFETRHRPHTPVLVHYDPSRPEDAVLYPGAMPEGHVFIFFGAFAGFMSLLAAMSVWCRPETKREVSRLPDPGLS